MTAATETRPSWEFTPHELGVYTAGYLDGWDAHGQRVSNWLGIVRAGLDAPTQQALAAARQPSNEPCRREQARPGSCRTCSQCTRYVATRANLAAFGQLDYPGTAEAARLRALAAS